MPSWAQLMMLHVESTRIDGTVQVVELWLLSRASALLAGTTTYTGSFLQVTHQRCVFFLVCLLFVCAYLRAAALVHMLVWRT